MVQSASRRRTDASRPRPALRMEDFPLSKLTVLDGDLSALSDPDANAIAAVYATATTATRQRNPTGRR